MKKENRRLKKTSRRDVKCHNKMVVFTMALKQYKEPQKLLIYGNGMFSGNNWNKKEPVLLEVLEIATFFNKAGTSLNSVQCRVCQLRLVVKLLHCRGVPSEKKIECHYWQGFFLSTTLILHQKLYFLLRHIKKKKK